MGLCQCGPTKCLAPPTKLFATSVPVLWVTKKFNTMQAPTPVNREISRDPRPKVAVDSGDETFGKETIEESTVNDQTKGASTRGDRKVVERSYSTDSEDIDYSDIPQEVEEDEEFRLAMELAMAAAQNPHLSPEEIQKLVGAKNKQREMVDEITKQKQKDLAELRKKESANGWWATAAKKAEEMKDRAERRLYADVIRKDTSMMEMRKKMKILRKTLKAHRLQGNRVETRHAFKRQRMEKNLFQAEGTLSKTQHLFTNSSYNVQEYLKAMMKASKKWRKKGTDEELMLEAQLCRNMHQMLALEKQKVKSKKNTKELKKYLQRCKGWLSDKEAFCEMNLMTLEVTQSSIHFLLDDTLKRQDTLIEKLKNSDEFKDIDLSKVDISHIKLPDFSLAKDIQRSASLRAMKGLPITDSIRIKKEHDERSKASRHTQEEARARAIEEAEARQRLVENYYKSKDQNQHELYVETKDDISVSSRLSDPDASGNHDSDSHFKFGNDGPWVAGDTSLDAVEEDHQSVAKGDHIPTRVPADGEGHDRSDRDHDEPSAGEEKNQKSIDDKDRVVTKGRQRTIAPIDDSESSAKESTSNKIAEERTPMKKKKAHRSTDEPSSDKTTSTKSTIEPKD
jgi:hypothetical protein